MGVLGKIVCIGWINWFEIWIWFLIKWLFDFYIIIKFVLFKVNMLCILLGGFFGVLFN